MSTWSSATCTGQHQQRWSGHASILSRSPTISSDIPLTACYYYSTRCTMPRSRMNGCADLASPWQEGCEDGVVINSLAGDGVDTLQPTQHTYLEYYNARQERCGKQAIRTSADFGQPGRTKRRRLTFGGEDALGGTRTHVACNQRGPTRNARGAPHACTGGSMYKLLLSACAASIAAVGSGSGLGGTTAAVPVVGYGRVAASSDKPMAASGNAPW